MWLYYIEAKDQSALERAQELLGTQSLDSEWDFAIGPRLEMKSSWSSNVISILGASGIAGIRRVERYRCFVKGEEPPFDELTQMKVIKGKAWPLPQPNRLEDGIIPLDQLSSYNQSAGLGFDDQDLEFYSNLFEKRGSSPTVAELHDLSNSNSEHSRHHLFRGTFIVPNEHYGGLESVIPVSLMDLIRLPMTKTKSTNSVVAICDNASAIQGWQGTWLRPTSVDGPSIMIRQKALAHITFTAETHNFPTGIAPFQGATTGTGGRIRDTQAIGRGGVFVAGTAGYCVGRIPRKKYPFERWSPVEILLRASDGASDYGNKIGEPVIQGFTRSYGDPKHEWLKPVMFSGGMGRVFEKDAQKSQPPSGMLIFRVGGPTYRIGIGGGAASSTAQSSSDLLLSAVQRGDAQMENRMDRWLRACISLPRNPIVSIHDQGAGGMANVTKEIAEDMGAEVVLHEVELGDETLSDAEIWVAESQEQNTVLARQKDSDLLKRIAEREGVSIRCVGRIVDSGRIEVYGRKTKSLVVQLPLSGISPPQKTYRLPTKSEKIGERPALPVFKALTADSMFQKLSSIDVCSKRFLTTKVDRSVSGLIAQQQCVGPQHVPVADVAVVAHDYFGFRGAATAIGEQPIEMLNDIDRGVRKAVAEMLSNLVWAPVTAFEDIKCSVNWMWPAGTPKGKATLLKAVKNMSDVMCNLGIAIDGGKDSVSMTTRLPDESRVDSPPQVVVSGYVACTDIRLVVTPGFKRVSSSVYLIFTSLRDMPRIFSALQGLICQGCVLAGHDVSDGGLTATIAEMCFASEQNYGVTVDDRVFYEFDLGLWDNDAAFVVETDCSSSCLQAFELDDLVRNVRYLGKVTKEAQVTFTGSTSLSVAVKDLREAWERPATELEMLQTAEGFAQDEHDWLVSSPKAPSYHFPTSNIKERLRADFKRAIGGPKAAVIRGEGSNGDREMAAALFMAGFQVYDLTTTDLITGRIDNLDAFQLIVFVGGFTYSDVLGAGNGWSTVLTRNKRAREMLQAFRKRNDTLTLGVCNGCQLLARLGWIGEPFVMRPNQSRRFESRFVTVKIMRDDVWFRDLKDTRMGVWVAHGEGRFPPHANIALRYVDEAGESTMSYPQNPNGSSEGAAAVTSSDGRVLAIMPHPERCVKRWQLPWMPPVLKELENKEDYTPWILLFRNAFEWCNSK